MVILLFQLVLKFKNHTEQKKTGLSVRVYRLHTV